MIKIMITCRNRLAITKKCIEALRRHTTTPFQLFVYDNNTNYLIKEHFEYWRKLYDEKILTQLVVTTEGSTFKAFSKAVASNLFGQQHELDPNKDKYDFLVILDNDIILLPKWDTYIKLAFKVVYKSRKDHIKIVTQIPGGVKCKTEKLDLGKDIFGYMGKLGGSGLWCIKPTFFKEIGFLNINQLVGCDKKHDQMYWGLLEKASQGKPYILALNQKLGLHCGPIAGSVCNNLSRLKMDPNKEEKIKFEEQEKSIEKENFDDFFRRVSQDKTFIKGW